MSKKRQRQTQGKIIDFADAKGNGSPIKIKRMRNVDIIPRNVNQEKYVIDLLDDDTSIVLGIGPAGTGKTLLATQAACKFLKDGKIERIVITRPAVSVDEQHGFLPGDINQKMEPWTRPIFDVLEMYWSPHEISAMLEDRVIEVAPLSYMRGRSFKNCFIIFDESQNSTIDQMKMALTRIGEGCKMAVTGDLKQHDRGFEKNGLYDFMRKLEGKPSTMISVVNFTKRDVERSKVVAEVLNLYGDD